MKSYARFLLGWLAITLVAQAQDTWLQADRAATTPGATFLVDLTSADEFGGFQTAIQPDRVARMVGRLSGASLPLTSGMATDRTLRFPVTVTRPGVVVIGVELKPQSLELSPDKIEARFRELHAGDEFRELWAAVPEPRRWRESSAQQVKAFVRVGETAALERGWAEPLGLALEIVPERDPTALRG